MKFLGISLQSAHEIGLICWYCLAVIKYAFSIAKGGTFTEVAFFLENYAYVGYYSFYYFCYTELFCSIHIQYCFYRQRELFFPSQKNSRKQLKPSWSYQPKLSLRGVSSCYSYLSLGSLSNTSVLGLQYLGESKSLSLPSW